MSMTLSEYLGRADTAQKQKKSCSCPACTGLQCLQRPRFFAGQLISDVDLNSEIDYILAKQRLHNRYLHGVGTVCGLEVVCNSCEGFVTINPGYAISPCGDDIIVCEQQTFDVAKAIRDCCSSRKKTDDCDPYRPQGDAGCTGQEEHWCVTVSYVETPAYPVTPLRQSKKTCCGSSCRCSDPCSCGHGNGNGKSKQSTSACGCDSSSPTPSKNVSAPTACEPTRTVETFRFGVVPDPGNCTDSETLLQGTLLGNLLNCVGDLASMETKIPAASLSIIELARQGGLAQSQTSSADAYTACCRYRQFVLDVLSHSAITHCESTKTYEGLACPPPPNQQPGGANVDPTYLASIQASIEASDRALWEALVECICHNLMPPCAPDPTGNCLVLACLTVKDGEIVDICNFGCRPFAGAFPSFFYWLSLIPIIPMLKSLVTSICCGETDEPREAAVNRSDTFRKAMMQSRFAMPKATFSRVSQVVQKISLDKLSAAIPTADLNLTSLEGVPSKDALSALKARGVTYEVRQVDSAAEIPVTDRSFSFFAKKGESVVVYESGDRVLRAQPAAAAAVAGHTAVISDLRTQVEALHAEVAKLKKARK